MFRLLFGDQGEAMAHGGEGFGGEVDEAVECGEGGV